MGSITHEHHFEKGSDGPLQLYCQRGSEWPHGKRITLRHPLAQETLRILRPWRAYGKRAWATGELKGALEASRRRECLGILRKDRPWTKEELRWVRVHGAGVSDHQFQDILHVLERECVMARKIDLDSDAPWYPPVGDRRTHIPWTVGVRGRHDRGKWIIRDFDAHTSMMMDVPLGPGQALEVRVHFNRRLRIEDYVDLREALRRKPLTKWGEELERVLQGGGKQGFSMDSMDSRMVEYEVQTHTGFYSQFYAKFPDLDDGGLLDFVSAEDRLP